MGILYITFTPHWYMLKEEKLSSDDIIKNGAEYRDQVETRMSIKNFLKDAAKNIRSLDYIRYCDVDTSKPKIKRGLSNYVEIGFKYPDGLTDVEIEKYYKYDIRFSDHNDKHKPEYKTRYYVNMVGMKTRNLSKKALQIFKKNLEDVQKRIRDFEIEKFGEQKTFITDRPKNNVDEVYANQPNMMTIRNQLMNKLGDDFKITGGSTVPKIIVASEQRPSITFEITPNGQNVDIVPKYDNIPDTVHKKRGIAYMRAANILYDFIMNTVKTKSERVERNMKLTIKESWEDPENFSYLDDPFSELKKAINNYFNEYHDPVHTKVYFKDLNYDDIWAMDMKVSAYDGTSNKTYSLEYRDPYDGILYVRPQNGSWETFYDFKSFLDWLDEDLDNLF